MVSFPSNRGESTMTAMDPRIWSKLPDHLLEHVLSFLPLKSFLSLRSTCKHFNSLLYTPCFISRHQSPRPFSFLLLSHPHFHHKCPLFNTLDNTWCNMLLSFPSIPSSHLVASSHGLLCFSAPRSSCFIVCNLLSRSLRHIKFPICPFAYDLPTLVVSGAANGSSYKLFVISSTGSTRDALVYDFVPGTWQQFGGLNPILNENYHKKGRSLQQRTVVHHTRAFPHCELLRGEQWVGEARPPIGLPDEVTFIQLAGDGDQKLYLVGGVGVSGNSRSIKLWELGEDGERWMEVETMPEMVCRKFLSVCYHNYEHVYCFWHQGLICICCYTWPEILYYKVSRRIWHWLPKSPSLPDKWSCGFRWFSFTPQLYASV